MAGLADGQCQAVNDLNTAIEVQDGKCSVVTQFSLHLIIDTLAQLAFEPQTRIPNSKSVHFCIEIVFNTGFQDPECFQF